MLFFNRYLVRVSRAIRRNKLRSFLVVMALVLASIVGNTFTFYIFDGARNPEIGFGDSLWYSIISITTIGYGDYSAQSLGARLGTVFFVVLVGLTTFTALLGMVLDLIIELNYKEKRGMSDTFSKEHVLLVNFPSEERVRSIIEDLSSDPRQRDKEIVLVSNQIDEVPFEFKHVSFVKGSPLQGETFERANARQASTAIVLASRYDDPTSDSLVSSVVSVVEHINPNIRTIAECLDEKHEFLFKATNCDSIIFPMRIANNLIVQETYDSGVSSFIDILTSNRKGETVFSTLLSGEYDCFGKSYLSFARQLLEGGVNLLSIVRQGENRTNFIGLQMEKDDVLVYVAAERKSPEYLIKIAQRA